MSDLHKFKAISFDCYGTLIDWEKGLLAVLRPWFASEGADVSDDDILEAFGILESDEEAEVPSAPYPEILEGVHIAMARKFNIKSNRTHRQAFMDSVGIWPAFSDTRAALQSLQKDYKLIILSNVDNASFKKTQRLLGIEFDAIYTAEDICAYKPSKKNFLYLLEHAKRDLNLDKKDILHTAQSLYHDHITAQSLGLKTCWIDRRMESKKQASSGATPEVEEQITPHWTFFNMAEFATAMKKS